MGEILFPLSKYQQKLFFSASFTPLRNVGGGTISQALSDMTLWLIGHDSQDIDLARQRWIDSSRRGQVVYLTPFETLFLDSEGLLRLRGGPGILLHNRQTYTKVSRWPPSGDRPSSIETTTHEGLLVTRLENVLPDMEVNWKVSQLYLFEMKKADILLQVVTADRHL